MSDSDHSQRGAKARDQGFTLVEALVALSVFALAGVGLVSLQAYSISTLRGVESHVLAGMVAQNLLVETIASRTSPDLGVEAGEVSMGERNWSWRRGIEPTSDPGVVRVSVTVSETGRANASPVEAHGFRVAMSEQ
jgi:general secretion pathway protein I